MKLFKVFIAILFIALLFLGCGSKDGEKINIFSGGCNLLKGKPVAIVNPEIGKGFKDKRIVVPSKKFYKKTPKVYCSYYIEGSRKGTKIRGEWWYKNKNKKIYESIVVIRKKENFGLFTLAKPKKGWRPGKYNLLIYVNKRETPDVIVDFYIKRK